MARRRGLNPGGGWGGWILSWRHRILIGLIILGLLAGLPDLRRRIAAESGSRTVELVADLPSFTDLTQSYGQSVRTLLTQLRQAGVLALGIEEDSLASLSAAGRLTVLSGAGWLDARRAAGLGPLPFRVNPLGTYVFTDDAALADWLRGALRTALGPAVTVRSLPLSGVHAIYVDDAPALTFGAPLGFAPGAFRLARALHMAIVPRPEDSLSGLTPAATAELYQRVAGAGVPVAAVLFAGNSNEPIPGYPGSFAATVAAFRQQHWVLAVLETPEQLSNVAQPGIVQLDQALGERTVRTYSIPDWMLQSFRPQDIALAVLSQVNEFNIRLVYLHPLVTGPDPVAATLGLYRALAQDLRAQGYLLGPPQPFAQVRVGRLQRVLQGLATVAGGLLLLELLLPAIGRWGYQPLAVLGVLVSLLCAGSATLSVAVVALGAGIVFGGLGMFYAADVWGRARWPSQQPALGLLWWRSVVLVLTVAGITFCGALLIATLMGSTPYFLEWRYFRGVKLTFLAIPFLTALAFMVTAGIGDGGRPGQRRLDLWQQIRALGEETVKFKYVAAFALVGAIGAIYLIRSGNAPSAFVPGIEVHMRHALERLLRYRPREKDFLVGYPSFFLATFFAARRQRWPFLFFLLGASAGQVALVDSFGTVRTPFMHSVFREGYGMLLGVLVGSIGLAVVQAAAHLWERGGRAALAAAVGWPAAAGSAAPAPPGAGERRAHGAGALAGSRRPSHRRPRGGRSR